MIREMSISVHDDHPFIIEFEKVVRSVSYKCIWKPVSVVAHAVGFNGILATEFGV